MMLVDAPARQNASAMQTSTSSRSNSGGGSTDPRAQPFQFIGWENLSGAVGSHLRDFGPFCPFLVPLKPGCQREQSTTAVNRCDSMAF
jgi:hypothetical protein